MWSKNVGQDPLKIHLNKFIFSLFLKERLKVFNYFSTVAKQLHSVAFSKTRSYEVIQPISCQLYSKCLQFLSFLKSLCDYTAA